MHKSIHNDTFISRCYYKHVKTTILLSGGVVAANSGSALVYDVNVAHPMNGCLLTDLVVVTGVRVGLGGLALGLEELVVADGGEGGGLVNDRGSVNPLVNGDGLVNSGGLDGLSLDNGLD